MTPHLTYKLNVAKKVLLAAAATVTIVAPMAIASFFATPTSAIAQAPPSSAPADRAVREQQHLVLSDEQTAFQSVTIQPGSVNGPWGIGVGPGQFKSFYTLRALIAAGYDVPSGLISGPDALDAKYNVDATAPGAFTDAGYKSVDAARAMVRKMLEDRFHLQVHHGTQSVSAYVLGAGGANVLMKADAEFGPRIGADATSIRGTGVRMDDFVELLSQRLDRPVLDQTGLTQTYDFTVDWKVNALPALPGMPETLGRPTPEVLASALQTQLGLTLKSTTGPVDFLVVDHVEEPSPN
jgi:uncharacterized protein (TIGR03435 family)